MKELKAKSRLISRPWIVFVAIIIISIYVASNNLLSINASFMFAIIMVFFNYITSIGRFYKFKYDTHRILVSNSWYPFIHEEFSVADIEQVKLTVATNIGNAVVLCFTNGKRKLYGIQANKEDIDEMIDFIQTEIAKRD